MERSAGVRDRGGGGAVVAARVVVRAGVHGAVHHARVEAHVLHDVDLAIVGPARFAAAADNIQMAGQVPTPQGSLARISKKP